LFRELKNLDEMLAAYGVEAEALAMSSRYEEPVKALIWFFLYCFGRAHQEPVRVDDDSRNR